MSATGIGAAVRRKEDLRFITGKGQYTDDVTRPGETRAVFVRSPHARAKIKKIDASEAIKMPGVVALFEITIRKVPLGSRTLILCTSISPNTCLAGAGALWPAIALLVSEPAQARVSTPE